MEVLEVPSHLLRNTSIPYKNTRFGRLFNLKIYFYISACLFMCNEFINLICEQHHWARNSYPRWLKSLVILALSYKISPVNGIWAVAIRKPRMWNFTPCLPLKCATSSQFGTIYETKSWIKTCLYFLFIFGLLDFRGMPVEDPTGYSWAWLEANNWNYPFANDGLILWDAIKEWVSDYVNHYYRDPNLIESDTELQGWWTEVEPKVMQKTESPA